MPMLTVRWWRHTLVAMQLVAVANANAQARPRLDGRWTVAPDSITAGGAVAAANAGSGWGPAMMIAQNDALLTVEVPFFSRYDMQPPLRLQYALDGGETKNTIMVGRGLQEQRSRATWRDAVLVITTTHVAADPTRTGDSLRVEVTQRLRLDAPTRLVIETTRAGVLGGPAVSTRTSYTKQ